MRSARYLPRFAARCAAFAAALTAATALGAASQPTITVAASSDSYPYSFVGADGQVQGFAVELLDAVAHDQGLRVERTVGPGAQINARFGAGEFDCIQLLTETPAREAYVEFTVPLLEHVATVVARTGSGIHHPSDLSHRRVLFVTSGSPGPDYLRDQHIAATLGYAPSAEVALREVSAGRADATFLARLTALSLIKRDHLPGVELLPDLLPGYDIRHCTAVHRGNAALLARLNEGLAKVQRSGEYARIYHRWFGQFAPKPVSREALVECGIAILTLAFVAAFWAFLHQRALHRDLAGQARELSEQRALLQALYDNIPTGMTVVSIERGSTHILSSNREASRLLVGNVTDWLTDAISRRPTDGKITHYEWPCTATRRLFAVTLVPLAAGGGAAERLCVLAEDVTARRQADAEIAQSRRLRAVGELVGGIAHEFNNLLTPVLLKVGELQIARAKDVSLAQDLEVIAGAARRGAELTRRLLTFGRKGDARSDRVRVDAVVDNCFQLLRHTVDRRIQWENAVPPSLAPLRFNGTDLNQVLMNLLINARDTLLDKLAGDHDSEWEPLICVKAVSLPPETVKPTRPGPDGVALAGWRKVSVADNGMGIAPDVAERIFEPFFTTKEVGRGTGLGLATVWHIVTDAGGRVELEPTPRGGATFHVFLPDWQQEVKAVPSPQPTAPPPAGSLRILLVEDDPLVGKAITTMLGRHGHRVTLIGDGRDAARILDKGASEFELYVIDVNLPGIDGTELVKRARDRMPDVRILAMSGRVEESLRGRLRELGADQVISKPFSVEQFDTAVRDCLAASGSAILAAS